MKKIEIWEKNGFTIRLAKMSDIENYYNQNYNPLDKEVSRLTGCKESFTKEEVFSFFKKAIHNDDYYLFLITSPDGRIIGECAINDIDFNVRCASFRICIFHQNEREHGIGTWATKTIRDFAFDKLKLHRLELEVYSFNIRAEKVYSRLGFKKEGILRDAILDGNKYADIILMSILDNEWCELNKQFI